MIQQKQSIWNSLTAGVVLLLLQLPLIMGLLHFNAQHDHEDRCDIVSSQHIHEKKVDCSLYDVTLDVATSLAFAKAQCLPTPLITKPALHFKEEVYTSPFYSHTSRGPPVC